VNWKHIRLCDECGAGNPGDATQCVECGSAKLGAPKGPPKAPLSPEVIDLRQTSYDDEHCPSCNGDSVARGILVPAKLPNACQIAVVPGLRCRECGHMGPRPSLTDDAERTIRSARPALSTRWSHNWVFLSKSAVVMDTLPDTPANEDAKHPLGLPRTVPVVSTSTIASAAHGLCLRLEFSPALDRRGLIITFLIADSGSWVEVTPNIGNTYIPSDWWQWIGKRDVQEADRILKALVSLDIWELPECVTPVLDGIGFHHSASTPERTHSIVMFNPSYHGNLKYVDIVNLYSDEFFDGKTFHQMHNYDQFIARGRRAVAKADGKRPWWKLW